MEEPRVVANPTAETKKIAETWRANDLKRRTGLAAKQHEKRKAEKANEIKNRKTNQEIVDMAEFQEWCEEHGIEPTKRQAGKHREEFENYLSSTKEGTQLKKVA